MAATENDKIGLVVLCIWDSSLATAEFLNLFHSMSHNCGRGSEVAVLK